MPTNTRILVADDDDGARNIVVKILEKEGFNVTATPNGAAALAAATEGFFDLAVVDVSMPVMDGHELVEKLRGLSKYAQVPIIMVTGASGDEDIVKGFELGVSDYIVKPFNKDDLIARVWRLLRTR